MKGEIRLRIPVRSETVRHNELNTATEPYPQAYRQIFQAPMRHRPASLKEILSVNPIRREAYNKMSQFQLEMISLEPMA